MVRMTARRQREANAPQKMPLHRIRTGEDLEDDSIDSRHHVTNSVDGRILKASPNSAERPVDTLNVRENAMRTKFNSDGTTDFSHLQQDTVGRRELQSHPTNDALRGVSTDHQRTDSTDSRVLKAHTTPDGIDPESENYRTGGGAQRAAGRYHIKPWAIRREHVPDGEMPWAKMDGDLPGSRLSGVPADKLPNIPDSKLPTGSRLGAWQEGTAGKGGAARFKAQAGLFIAQFKDSNGEWVPFVGGANDMSMRISGDSITVTNNSKKSRAIRVKALY